jgi:hypothetical protein
MRFRATVVVALLGLALVGRPVKADSFHVTGQTDATACTTVHWCSDISYSLDFITDPLSVFPPPAFVGISFYTVDAVGGQINGIAVSCTRTIGVISCGDLLASYGTWFAGPPVPDGNMGLFGSGGISVGLHGGTDSGIPLPSIGVVAITIGDLGAYTNWNIVSTPEPSILLFLTIGLLGLMGLTLLKNRLS